MSLTLT